MIFMIRPLKLTEKKLCHSPKNVFNTLESRSSKSKERIIAEKISLEGSLKAPDD